MATPIFDEVMGGNPFSSFPAIYTDRYTPEVARQQGYKQGAEDLRNQILKALISIKKPSKQLLQAIELVREIGDE